MVDRLAWVTARAARGRDEDEPLALAALERAGVAVEVVDWDDPTIDWSHFDRVVLRSPWDYTDRLTEFLAWLEGVGAVTDVVNPPALVRWNADKRYLADLEAAGVPVTPTTFVPPGEAATFPDGAFVVKPAVGAGSRDAASYGASQHELAAAHIDRMHAAGRVALVQPLLESVAREGEWPLVFFASAFSHAARKRITLPKGEVIEGLYAEETNTAHEASPAQIEVARAAVEHVTERFGSAPPYARIDLVRDAAGSFRVLEAELIEPSLFLPYADAGAAGRLAFALSA